MVDKLVKQYLLIILALFIMIIPFQPSSRADEVKKSFKLDITDGLINIQAESVSFKEILRELENKTGIKVNIIGELPDKKVILNIMPNKNHYLAPG